MKKLRVLGIAPYEGMKTLMQEVAEHRNDIELTAYVGDLNEGLRIASKYTPDDFDIIISRGGTAELLQEKCSIPVVEVNLSAMDILRALQLVNNVSNKYAMVGFPSITKFARLLCDSLKYNIEIYTIHNKAEAENILMELSRKGYSIILCDMITYSLAQAIGLTAILITSGPESIELAFDQAIKTRKAFSHLTSQVLLFKSLLESNPHDIYVYNKASELVYSPELDSLPDIIRKELQDKVPIVRREKNIRMFKVVLGTMYDIKGVYKALDGEDYVIYYINANKAPLSMIKDGIQYLNKDDVLNKILESFYGITQSVLYPDPFIKKYSNNPYPIVILGEEGTGKEHLAYSLYAKGSISSNPLVVIDCIRFSSKDWSLLTNDVASPLNETTITIYFKNMELLTDQKFDELFSLIHDLKLYKKSKLLFTFTLSTNESAVRRYNQIINHFSCMTIQVPALRDQVELIPDIFTVYISNLNLSMAKSILGFDPDALDLLKSYDWPGNYNQFKRIINELIMNTDTPYIKASTVNKILKRETKAPSSDTSSNLFALSIKDKTLEEINLNIIHQVLLEENGNHSAAAKRLGISRTTLWRMLQKKPISD